MKGLKMMLLGAPGAGKGTQAKMIASEFGIPQISTGDMLREAKAKGTELGLEAKRYMDAGQLVPDEVVIGLVVERLQAPDAEKGFIFDGFPRTIGQAEAMDQREIALDSVFNIEVPVEELVRRLTGRRTCSHCGMMYHIEFSPPEERGICDKDGEALIQRSDDSPKIIRDRLEVYNEKTAPLLAFYRDKGILHDIDGARSTDDVFNQIKRILTA